MNEDLFNHRIIPLQVQNELVLPLLFNRVLANNFTIHIKKNSGEFRCPTVKTGKKVQQSHAEYRVYKKNYIKFKYVSTKQKQTFIK